LFKKVVYKKYTFKHGRKYGPYLYENKRVGEKVVTNYLGRGDVGGKSKLVYVFIAILLLGIIGFVIFNYFAPTGKVVADLSKITYKEGETLAGTVRFNIRSGELIPRDTKVVIRNGNVESELLLSDIAINVNPVYGSFYAENRSISSEGQGYGVLGEAKVYPEVNFQLLVSNFNAGESNNFGNSDGGDIGFNENG